MIVIGQTHSETVRKCEDCSATHKSDYWNNIKASKEGWFSLKSNKDYCPLHVPSWVENWRKRNANL